MAQVVHDNRASDDADRRGIALRVVERDRAWRQPLDGLAEGGSDALVVADHVVRADIRHASRVDPVIFQ
jgi:hypothetical protein